MVRVDLHIHSSASFDCASEPRRVAARCHRLGLSPVFLTDHDSIDGAVQLQKMSIGKVVTGQEVLTTEGEIIGLFLTRPVKSGLTAKQAALEIKGDGGLVYLEHPYDRARRSLSEVGIEEVADLIDIVEVFNGRSDEKANHLAEDLRATLGAAPGAGSDAHLLEEIGSVYIEMEPFDGAGDFLAKLRRSRIVKHRNQFLLTAEALLRHTMGRQ